MARGVDGRETYVDDRDRELFLTALAELKTETDFSLLAYCLMGNHFHLAIKVGHIPLSNILQRLLTRYALTFNARHDRTGHLFQARYKALLCVDETYLLRLIGYIHANPVRSGLVPRAEDWPWSSAQACALNRRTELIDPSALPDVLGLNNNGQTAHGGFDPWPTSPTKPVLLRLPAAVRIPIESLADSLSSSLGFPIDILKSQGRSPEILRAKRAFIADCLAKGLTLSEISRWLGCTAGTVHYLAYGRTS